MTSLALSVDALLVAGSAVGPVIGIDTGGPIAHLGLAARGQILSSISRELSSHCAGLPGTVEELLTAARLRITDLAGIAVALGPGSFTGLRVGLSYAKGLTGASPLAIVGAPTLDCMALAAARSAVPGRSLCPVLDARRGELYAALYRFSADALEKITDDLALRPDELADQIPGEVVFAGGEKALEMAALLEPRGASARVVPVSAQMGGYLAAMGAAAIARKQTDDAATLEPLYVRAAGASLNSTVKTGARSNGTSRGRTDPALRNA